MEQAPTPRAIMSNKRPPPPPPSLSLKKSRESRISSHENSGRKVTWKASFNFFCRDNKIKVNKFTFQNFASRTFTLSSGGDRPNNFNILRDR